MSSAAAVLGAILHSSGLRWALLTDHEAARHRPAARRPQRAPTGHFASEPDGGSARSPPQYSITLSVSVGSKLNRCRGRRPTGGGGAHIHWYI